MKLIFISCIYSTFTYYHYSKDLFPTSIHKIFFIQTFCQFTCEKIVNFKDTRIVHEKHFFESLKSKVKLLKNSRIKCQPNPFKDSTCLSGNEVFEYKIYSYGKFIEGDSGKKIYFAGKKLFVGTYILKLTTPSGTITTEIKKVK